MRSEKQPPEALNDRLLDLAVEAVLRVGWTSATVEAKEFDESQATYRVGSNVELCFISPRAAFTLTDEDIVVAAATALQSGGDLAIVALGGLSEEVWMRSQGLLDDT